MKKLIVFLLFCGSLFMPSLLMASSITGVSSFAVTSAMMAGMEVTVTFSDDRTSITKSWSDTGSDAYGHSIFGVTESDAGSIADSSWYIINTPYSADFDDTYWNSWTIFNNSNLGIKEITFNAIDVEIMFDIIHSSDYPNYSDKTANSADGWWDGNENNGSIADYFTWSFSDPISIGASTPLQDLWGALTLTARDTVNGFTNTNNDGEALNYYLDTDLTKAGEVPEPATMLLFGLGLLGLSAASRKKGTS